MWAMLFLSKCYISFSTESFIVLTKSVLLQNLPFCSLLMNLIRLVKFQIFLDSIFYILQLNCNLYSVCNFNKENLFYSRRKSNVWVSNAEISYMLFPLIDKELTWCGRCCRYGYSECILHSLNCWINVSNYIFLKTLFSYFPWVSYSINEVSFVAKFPILISFDK